MKITEKEQIIWRLYEKSVKVKSSVKCFSCGRKDYLNVDSFEAAVLLQDGGWHATRAGRCYCEKCKQSLVFYANEGKGTV